MTVEENGSSKWLQVPLSVLRSHHDIPLLGIGSHNGFLSLVSLVKVSILAVKYRETWLGGKASDSVMLKEIYNVKLYDQAIEMVTFSMEKYYVATGCTESDSVYIVSFADKVISTIMNLSNKG